MSPGDGSSPARPSSLIQEQKPNPSPSKLLFLSFVPPRRLLHPLPSLPPNLFFFGWFWPASTSWNGLPSNYPIDQEKVMLMTPLSSRLGAHIIIFHPYSPILGSDINCWTHLHLPSPLVWKTRG